MVYSHSSQNLQRHLSLPSLLHSNYSSKIVEVIHLKHSYSRPIHIPFATAIDQSMYRTYLRSHFVKYKNRDTIIKPQIKVILKFMEHGRCKIIVQRFEKLAKILPFWILQKFVGIILSRVLCNWLLPRVLFSCVFRAFGKWFLLSCCKITRVTRRY